MTLTRRQFHHWAAAVAAASALRRTSFAAATDGPVLGLNTFSLRAFSQDEAIPAILSVMKQAGLTDCELLFSHVEPAKFSPVFGTGPYAAPKAPPTQQELDARKATAAALTEWRMTVPMSYFENIRSAFTSQGLRIRAFNARLGSTDAEVDRQFLMAKSLGADTIIARIPEASTAMVATVAERHGTRVSLQFSDSALVHRQLAASHLFSLDPDTGDLTRGGTDALQFVKDNIHAITSLDLKDVTPGVGSVPFGQGQAHLHEIVAFLKQSRAAITTYIDCDYPGTGRSAEEVLKCVSYIRGSTPQLA